MTTRFSFCPSALSKAFLATAGLSLITVACTGSERFDSKANDVEIGTNKAAAIAIMGPPTRLDSTNVLGLTRETMVWESSSSRCEFVFLLDRVTAKTCTSPH